MGYVPMQEVAQAQQTAQHLVSNPEVTWEVFKWVIGALAGYITGSYLLTGGLFWRVFSMLREDRREAAKGRSELWKSIEKIQTNHIAHLESDVKYLKERCALFKKENKNDS